MANQKSSSTATGNVSHESDEELLSKFVRSDDHDAFHEIYRRYSKMVLGVCSRVLHNAEDIQDAYQATFLVLIKSAEKIRSKSSFASWLYGVAYRISLDARSRMGRRKQKNELEEIEIIDEPLVELMRINDLQVLEDELQRLPVQFRQPLTLYYMTEKSCPQIAKEIGISVSAVESRIRRGRARLKRSLVNRRVGLGVLMTSFGLGVSTTNAAILQPDCAQTILNAAVDGTASNLFSNDTFQLVSKELTNMTSHFSRIKPQPFGTALAIAICLFFIAATGAASHRGNSFEKEIVLGELPVDSTQTVSFRLSDKPNDDKEAGQLLRLRFVKDGGSVIYDFVGANGKKGILKIDNSFKAKQQGKGGTMYLDGVELDPKSMEARQILDWMKEWNRPKTYDQPSGTLLNVINGVSFSGYQFIGNDKTLKSIEIDRKTGEVREMGGSVISKDSRKWKRIEKWMDGWKPGRLFSSEKTDKGNLYYFLSRDLRKEAVLVSDGKVNNRYNRPLDPNSELVKDVKTWLPSWTKQK